MAYFKAQKVVLPDKTTKYYPYAVLVNKKPAETDELAKRAEKLCTVHYADIRAVLAVLPEVMAQLMNEGRSVRLQDFGSFRYAIDAKPGSGKDTPEAVSADDIRKTNIVFHPETKRETGGKATRALAPSGTEWVKLEGEAAAAAAETPETGSSTGGSSDTGSDDIEGI